MRYRTLFAITALICLSTGCKMGHENAASVKEQAASGEEKKAVPFTIIDDNGQTVSPDQLKDYGHDNDGSTIFTYTFTGAPLSDLEVAVWVWENVWGASAPHDADLDDNGNLRGAAGRIPLFNQSSTGGQFQIIPADDN